MPKFRKKPVVIEARQWDGSMDSQQDIVNWSKGAVAGFHGGSRDDYFLEVATLEGNHEAWPGDWIIKGVVGEFYPCREDIFAATYEPVDE